MLITELYHLHQLWFHCWSPHYSWSEDGKRLRTGSLLAQWEAWALGKEMESEWETCSWRWMNSLTEVSSLTLSSAQKQGRDEAPVHWHDRRHLLDVNEWKEAQTFLEWTSDATRLVWEWISGRLISGGGSGGLGTEGGSEGWLCVWLCRFSGVWVFTSIRPAARFLWAAIWERTLSALPPGGRKTWEQVVQSLFLLCQGVFVFVCVAVNLSDCGNPG